MTSAPIEALVFNDSDSGYDEKTLSTASLRSSIYEYDKENGRTYSAYKAGKKYALPNDEDEQNRMDIHHTGLRLAMGKHFFAPIEHPTSILDVGTGTGIWAIEVADLFPGATVVGTDISPIQSTWVPPNVEFQVADVDDPWNMPQRFDLIHTSNMNGFSIKSWPKFYLQALEALKPGGWVENQEFDLLFKSDDGTMPADGAVMKWTALWNQGVERMGLTGRCYPEAMKQQMEEAGFINVQIIPIKVPIGPWPKDKQLRLAGQFFLVGVLEGVSGLSMRVFTQMLGWSVEELEVLLVDVRKEWSTKGIHSYVPYFMVFGQKPPTLS